MRPYSRHFAFAFAALVISVGVAHAQNAAAGFPSGPTLLAVTVLTSMDSPQLAAVGVPSAPADEVIRLAILAQAAGIPGMVCSPEEVSVLRSVLGPAPLLVVPGIRPAGSDAGDQRRTATPAQAIAVGASMLVIGRPITRAAEPLSAFTSILTEIAESTTSSQHASLTSH